MDKNNKHIVLRTYLIYFGFVAIMLTVIVKSFMIYKDGRNNIFVASSEKIEFKTAEIIPRRGEILDANLSPLVTSVSFYDIYMDTKVVKEDVWREGIEGLSKGLAELFPEKSAREWREYLSRERSRKNQYCRIQRRVTNDTRKQLRALPIFKLGKYKGGIIDQEEIIIRQKPHEDLLKRTLGYVRYREDDTLRVGIEGAFNNYLQGQNGEIIQQKISNSWKTTGPITKETQDGADVVTSIDKDIQEVAHTELLRQLQNKGGKYGCAIVMDVKTGFIKAMVNLEENKDGGYDESYNHAIGTIEVPGSTFKLASLMAALEDEKIKLTDTVNAVGKYQFFDRTLNDDNKWGYGKITIQRAFEKSSNVISKIIFDNYREEPEKFLERLDQFGITQPLNIDIAGEKAPMVNRPGTPQWWGGSIAWMSIGYEVQQTPLQTLAFYNAVANDGKFMKPQFVSEIREGTEVVKKFEPIVLREKICSQPTLDALQKCLSGVVEHGTGRALRKSFFKLAGKTGTAQIANQNKGYGEIGDQKYIASFCGYFPAENPVYSCIVVVSAPTNDIYGASVSGTVFAEIADKVYSTSLQYQDAINQGSGVFDTPITKSGNGYELKQVLDALNIRTQGSSSAEWVRTFQQTNGVEFRTAEIQKSLVPKVIGMGLKDAVILLEQAGLKVRAKGVGRVTAQSLAPGSPAVVGGIIEIELN